jgi:endonuclease YncB( thermonuclease family)
MVAFGHALSICLLIFSLSAYAAGLTGCIVGVHDGDTVTLLDSNKQQHKIRLKGIDAPEAHQAFGQ